MAYEQPDLPMYSQIMMKLAQGKFIHTTASEMGFDGAEGELFYCEEFGDELVAVVDIAPHLTTVTVVDANTGAEYLYSAEGEILER